MTIMIVLFAILLTYLSTALYIHKANQYLAASKEPWDRLYEAAKDVIGDSEMPTEAANFAAAAVLCAGCGCLSRQVVLDSVFARKIPKSPRKREMTDSQRKSMAKVVVNAIYYDTLRAPLSGLIVRKFIFPWLRAASQGQAVPHTRGVRRLASSSREAISHRSYGRRILGNMSI